MTRLLLSALAVACLVTISPQTPQVLLGVLGGAMAAFVLGRLIEICAS